LKIRTRFFFYVIMVLLVLTLVEAISFLTTRVLQDKGVIYKPSISDSYKDYLLKRDNLLGWPPPDGFGNDDNYDLRGSRIVPAFPDAARYQSCISLYGDSFTWSSEVDNEHAWGNVLSTLVGCRVANYGIGGYGSDQAYIRFRQNANDESSIVFLNHLSENILRNVNQFRDLLYPGKGLGFKPRFILNEEGNLELLPIPTFDVAQYKDVILHPNKYLKNEYFLPSGPSGNTVASFPYTISVIKSLKHFQLKAKLRNEPWYLEFYNRNHPSRALETTSAILKGFNNDANERGKVPIITIIPTGKDLLFFLEHRGWPYDSLIDDLSRHGISVFNFGTGILKHINNSDPCSLFDNCSAHYNEKGYKILANVAYELLIERQLLDKTGLHNNPIKRTPRDARASHR
jgi:hypothetical protein